MQDQRDSQEVRGEARPEAKRPWSKLAEVLRWLWPADSRLELLVDEASALLEGRAADLYIERDMPVPYWAWLNALARRPIGEVEQMAIDLPGEPWSDATIEIAALLTRCGRAEASLIKRELFLPAELRALSQQEGCPEALARAVRRRLSSRNLRRQRPVA